MESSKIKSINFDDTIFDLSVQLKSKNNEIRSILQYQEELLREITHNLKNPLGVISSFTEMILEDVNNYPPELITKYLTIIKNSANYSIECLNSISQISRLNSQKTKFILKRDNYINLLNKIIANFYPLASQKNITIIQNFNSKSKILFIDAEELTFAISNIIDNSIRFSLPNSTVTISTTEDHNSTKISIQDEGIGVESKDISKLFEEFYVVNTFSNDNEKCIGLGLSIAQKIIYRHNGSITFNSTIDKGSMVEITLNN